MTGKGEAVKEALNTSLTFQSRVALETLRPRQLCNTIKEMRAHVNALSCDIPCGCLADSIKVVPSLEILLHSRNKNSSNRYKHFMVIFYTFVHYYECDKEK